MADNNTTRETKGKGKDKSSVLAEVRERWSRGQEKERDNISKAYDDLKFLAGDDYDQWPEKQRRERENDGRPVLQLNELPQFVHQITGDIRQMRPSIKVVPVDSQSDPKTADILGGLVRYIENRSDAQAIYFRAADSQVAAGIGHWRILTEYADDTTFNQEIRIAPVDDGVSVLWDPDSVLPSREDADFCFVPVDVSRKAFEEKYPDVTPSEFDDDTWSENKEWVTDDYVRIAEYWTKKPSKRKLALLPSGEIADVTDAEPDVVAFYLSKQARIEERDSYKVCRYLVTASDVIEGPLEWPGRHIPIVPVIGEEIRLGRKIIRKGIVRDAIDPQRMLNYFHSAHTETVALQPKAPFLVTERNVAKYQDTWEQANTKNLPYLPFEPDTQNGGAAPQRVQPPVSSQGILDGLTLAKEAMRGVIGIYDPSLGAKSNETSGKAILARQREGDVGSYLFIDNFSRAVRRTGQIIIDLIPHVYDTERTIRIMGEDGKVDLLEINKANGLNQETGQTNYLNDVTIGSYDVVATVGPSYTTRREEARESMIAFLQAAPDTAPLILDLLAKAQDWPMADDIAKRIRANLPPAILAMEEAEKQGMDPEQARQQFMEQNQPPPDPKMLEVQRKAQADQTQFQLQQMEMMSNMRLEMARMAEESKRAQSEIMANFQKMILDSQTKIEVAQINAGVGMHKNIVQAGTEQMKTETSAGIEYHKIDTAADTARYQTDNRPEPGAQA